MSHFVFQHDSATDSTCCSAKLSPLFLDPELRFLSSPELNAIENKI